MDCLGKYIPIDVQERLKLEMMTINPIFEKSAFYSALRMPKLSSELTIRESLKNRDSSGPGNSKIKDSWIYEHFSDKHKKQSKIALYVNQIIPINQNLDASKINFVGNHCVVVRGLTKWPENNPNGIECLELEIHGGSNELRYIPVDFPFFEEIQIEVQRIYETSFIHEQKGAENYNRAMNKFGKKLAEKKWGKIEKNWYDQKRKPKHCREEIDKYEMIFIRGIYPSFQLHFTF